MAKKKTAVMATDDPTKVRVEQLPSESAGDTLARVALKTSLQAGLTIEKYSKEFGELSLDGLCKQLTAQCKAANDGDLSKPEAILIAQAHTLDTLFNSLARRAALNMGEYMNAADTYLRLALKAQSQCRATIETLAEMKNPKPVAFVKQANITSGPQQVNNGSLAREKENEPNKQLQHQATERLDFGAQSAAGGVNSNVEAVGAIQRA